MAVGLLVPLRRRPTVGALYVGAVAAFAVLMLALTATGAAQPLALAVIAVPLGPLGILAAAFALPTLTGPPSAAIAALVLAAALAIGALNVMIASALASSAARRATRDPLR